MRHELWSAGRVDDGRPAPGVVRALLRQRVALLLAPAQSGRLLVTLPDGHRIDQRGTSDGPSATLAINSWSLLWAVVARGSIGFAEAYMEGHWSSPDLTRLLEWFARNRVALTRTAAGPFTARLADRLQHATRANTRRNSRRNIAEHYDLGNAFYAEWLDAGMNYSAGLYGDERTPLAEAQAAKVSRVCELLELAPGHRVLEIGCGWGAVMDAASARGAAMTGITLSVEQQRYTRQRLAAGRRAPWDVRLQDYRDASGQYDRIVSIEMLEAVGEAYWPAYFRQLHDLLAPGGSAVVQVITIASERFAYYRRRPDFIQRYIFPGGMLPTPEIVCAQAQAAGLGLDLRQDFGMSYAYTLRDWRVRFLSAWPRLAPLGFDVRFKRMWEYYLSYCEAGFRHQALDVHLFRFRKP